MRAASGACAVAALAALAAFAPPSGFAGAVEGTHLFGIEIAGTPEGLLQAAGVLGPARAEAVVDLIERLHIRGEDSAGLAHYTETLTTFLNAWRLGRMRGKVSLEAVAENSRARGRVAEFLESAGFRLERRGSTNRVLRDHGEDAKARRDALGAAGFPVDDLDARLNDGAAVTVEAPSFEIPSPLSAEVWREAVFQDPVPGERLGFRLLTDRRAALLYYGLISMTPETRRFLSANPGLLRDLYENDAIGLAAFGRSLVVRDGEVAVPGGAEAAGLWRSLAGERPDEPGEFFKAILRYDEGVMAFLYDFIARLDEPRQRFALGLWLEQRRRRSHFWRLYEVTAASVQIRADQPFARRYPEPTVLLSQVEVEEDGQPAGPAWERLWREAFSGHRLPRNPAGDVRGVERSDPVEAAWLVQRVFEDPGQVAVRQAAFLFAQRRFGDAEPAELADILVTLRGFRFFGGLVSVLDRMGVESPAIYAAAMRAAERLNEMNHPERARDALSQFQGVVALVDRARFVRSLSASASAELVASVAAVPFDEDRGYEGGVAAWIAGELLPALGAESPDADSGDPEVDGEFAYLFPAREQIVVRALAGALEDDGRDHRETASWEGYSYVADLRGATRARIAAAREAQGGASLDAALDLWRVADALISGPATVESVRQQARFLDTVEGGLPERVVPDAVTVADSLSRARRDLERIRSPRDAERRAPGVGERLLRLADGVLGDVLRSLTYAAWIGDPESGVLAGGDLSVRHDFGLDPDAGDLLRTTAWRLPAPEMETGRPWYAAGALVGLDLATADLRLSQIVTGIPPVHQTLTAADREVLTASVALFHSFDRSEAEIRAIAEAIGSGRRRVARLAEAPGDAAAAAAAAGLGGWRPALLGWIASREPERLDGWLSLRELFWLGWSESGAGESVADAASRFRGYGAYSGPADGCLCLRLAPPEPWENWRGRRGSGLVAAMAPDLTLWVAERLVVSGLPVSIAGSVLEVAMRHLLDRVQPSHLDDWNTILRYPSTLRAADFEDYVSSLTGTELLRPAEPPSSP